MTVGFGSSILTVLKSVFGLPRTGGYRRALIIIREPIRGCGEMEEVLLGSCGETVAEACEVTVD